MRWRTAFVLAAVLASGCAGAPAAPSSVSGPTFDDLGLAPVTATTGLIRGVVVDDSVHPVAGANVTLGAGPQSSLTDEQGRFGFSEVDPGLHFLQVSKPGYGPVQSSTETVAGVDEPKAVVIVLSRLAGSEPFVEQMLWNGFLECSWTVGGSFATGCLLAGTVFADDSSRQFDPIQRTPSFLQSELVWESTQTLGTNLCMRHYASEDIGGEVLMDDVCGPNPLVQQADGDRLAETKVGAGEGIERVVWVDGYGAHQGVGVALNQKVEVYTHLFYNFAPDPAWRFTVDGPYPLPA